MCVPIATGHALAFTHLFLLPAVEAYTVQCWSWEIVELARKLVLTSLLALVAPGSATQVTVGTLVAFGTLLLFQRYRP